MKKVEGFFSFFGLAFTQVAVSTAIIAYTELVLSRMGYTATGSWQFYVLHLLFLLPCVLLLTPAGFMSDKHPKERVLLWTTVLSVLPLGLFGVGVYHSCLPMMFAGVGLFFVLQAFQSPAKNGYMKELIGVRFLARGSGTLMIVTFCAMFFAGVSLAFAVRENLVEPVLYSLGALQVLGLIFAIRLPSIGAYDETLKFPWKQFLTFKYARRKMAKAWKNRALRQSIVGQAMFWVMIFLMVFVIQDQFSSGSLFTQDALANYAIFGTGIGLVAGFWFAMRMSRNFIEMGLIPMGTAGASILIFIIPLIPRPYNAIAFALLGFCGGIFALPMFATMLYNTKPRSAGHVLSLSNVVQNLSILVFDILAIVAIRYFAVDRMSLFFILGIVCLVGTVWALWAMPQTLLRQLLRSVLSMHYRFLVTGVQNIPWEGPVLLVGNHISYIDWAIIQMASPRPMRFVITRRPFEKWYVKLLLSQMETIDLDISNPAPAMEEAKKALLRGEAVVMFPENAMTSTGNMSRFRLDYSSVVKDVPRLKLLPFYVQGLWGSSYSMADAGFKDMVHSGGRIISVAFGNELPLDSNPMMVKRAVQELSITAWTSYIRKLRRWHLPGFAR